MKGKALRKHSLYEKRSLPLKCPFTYSEKKRCTPRFVNMPMFVMTCVWKSSSAKAQSYYEDWKNTYSWRLCSTLFVLRFWKGLGIYRIEIQKRFKYVLFIFRTNYNDCFYSSTTVIIRLYCAYSEKFRWHKAIDMYHLYIYALWKTCITQHDKDVFFITI